MTENGDGYWTARDHRHTGMGIEMERTKAEFRAVREMVGMSQQELADALDVQVLSVKRWERPDIDGCEPPDDAWDVLDDARKLQRQVVDFGISKVGQMAVDLKAEAEAVVLTYWRTQDAYDTAHPDEPGVYTMANANARLIADKLESFGYMVRFIYSPEENV